MKFKIDMHVHTILGGDSKIEPEEVVSLAKRNGLDAVCITEHHSYDTSKPFDSIREATGYPIFRGMEYKAKEGHLLVYGVNLSRGDMLPQMPMQHVINWVQSKGGVGVPAHPYQADMFGFCLGDRLMSLENVLAIEALNGSASKEENQTSFQVAGRMGWGKIGGSDAHGPRGIGKTFTVFPFKINKMTDLIKAIKSKDYFPSVATDMG
jgi:predicted metal-dependent phosphoesterase TrpH